MNPKDLTAIPKPNLGMAAFTTLFPFVVAKIINWLLVRKLEWATDGPTIEFVALFVAFAAVFTAVIVVGEVCHRRSA